MDSLQAFAMGDANRGKPSKVFDWNKAARLIKESGVKTASAGLSLDWEWTGGTIFEDGKPTNENYTYLASTWATPELDLDGEMVDCYVMQGDTEWDAGTKWPQSALDILGIPLAEPVAA